MELIDTYCGAWSEPDPVRRREVLAGVLTDDVAYTDPTVHTAGLDELVAHIGGVIARRPGAKVVRVSAVDTHHDLGRFGWHVVLPDGSMGADSIDVVEFAADGRLRRIIGFFGPVQG